MMIVGMWSMVGGGFSEKTVGLCARGVSEMQGAAYAVGRTSGRWAEGGACGADDGRLETHGEIGRDVEHGELGVDIGVDNREEVDTDEAEGGEVAVAAVEVLLSLENLLELVLASGDVVAGGQHVKVRLRVWVVVHDVEVGLRVVAVHHLVPRQGVGATDESSVEDGQFPEFAVVDLARSRQHEGEPQGAFGVGRELLGDHAGRADRACGKGDGVDSLSDGCGVGVSGFYRRRGGRLERIGLESGAFAGGVGQNGQSRNLGGGSDFCGGAGRRMEGRQDGC
mgnify:CR=1 FL=1